MVVVADELVAEEHHLPLQQGCTDFSDLLLAQRCGEIHAVYLGAGPSGLRTNLNCLCHLGHRCLPLSRNVI
jgi:hypothetical protein